MIIDTKTMAIFFMGKIYTCKLQTKSQQSFLFVHTLDREQNIKGFESSIVIFTP